VNSPHTVFVTNKSHSHDYTSASKLGALRFVTNGNYPIFKTIRLQEEIINALAYSSKDDYLLFSGSSVVAALAMAVWLEIHGVAKILLWDRTQDSYVVRVIETKQIRIEVETAKDLIEGRPTGMVRRGTSRT